MPVPTADMTGALVKTSASGPMPTSRYWLQAFCSISTCFSRIASVEPGLSFDRSSPTSRTTSLRIASAEAGLPRACSSITRSSIEIAKVTPAALSTCRSIGASSQGLVRSRRSGGVLARSASSAPIRSPPVSRKAAAGFVSSHRALSVGKRRVTSNTPSSRTTTTAGPCACGRNTRPTSVPLVPSSGRTSFAVRVIMRFLPGDPFSAEIHQVISTRAMGFASTAHPTPKRPHRRTA